MMFLMSQDRPSSRDGSKLLNHVLMQTSPNIQFNNNNNNNNNLIINKNTFLALESSGSVNKSNSNILIHNKNNSSCNIMTTTSVPSPTVNYITPTTTASNNDDKNEVNGNQQIVLIANEQLEPSDNEQPVSSEESDQRKITNGGDEELTPLHWLHDKNLLKGINLSCPKVQSPPDVNQQQQQQRNGVTRTTSNDDSVASDDTSRTLIEQQHQQMNSNSQQQQQQQSSSSPKPINYTTNENSNKLLTTTPQQQQQQQQFNNIINTVIVSSNNVIENGGIVSPNKTPSMNGNQEHHLQNHQINNNSNVINLSSEESINKIIKSPQKPHQHFHKKYLREQFKQQDDAEKMQQDFNHINQHLQSTTTTTIQQQNDQISNNIQNSHMSSYIITKAEPESRYIYSDDREFIANYNNNNNNTIQSNYEKNHEFDLSQKIIDYATPKSANSSYSSGSSITSSTSSSPSPKQKQHPNNIPYDPHVHTASKPPYSFSSLIFMAIEDSPQKALPVKEIYAWIIQHFPYFKTAPTGWKNSVRHNLSLNKCFQKVEKAANLGKGSLWMVEPQYRPNLIQALTRSPFHPCSTWEKHAKNLIKTPSDSPKQQSNGSARLPNPEHFPFLSRRLAAMESYDDEGQSRASTPSNTSYEIPQNYTTTTTNGMVIYQNNNNSIIINGNHLQNSDIVNREMNAETIDDVNAATAMLALKHGPKIFTEGIPFTHPPIITTSPSEDHTYSAFTGNNKNGTDNNSNGTSSDAAYESSEESPNVVYHFSQPSNEEEMEEQRRQAEGVDALLNLAGYNTNTTLLLKRPASVEETKPFEKKQYFYTTEIAPAAQYQTSDGYYDDEPPTKKPKSRILRNKLKKKTWFR